MPDQAGDEGRGELLEGQHRGHRIARVADDRLARHHPQQGGFARHHGDPVHQHFAQGGDGLVGVILGARGGAGVDQHQIGGGQGFL